MRDQLGGGRVTVWVEDHLGNLPRRAKIQRQAPLQEVIPALTAALCLPAATYQLFFNDKVLSLDETLQDAGVEDGSTLTLMAEISAGGPGEKRFERYTASGAPEHLLRDLARVDSPLGRSHVVAEEAVEAHELEVSVSLLPVDHLELRQWIAQGWTKIEIAEKLFTQEILKGAVVEGASRGLSVSVDDVISTLATREFGLERAALPTAPEPSWAVDSQTGEMLIAAILTINAALVDLVREMSALKEDLRSMHESSDKSEVE